MSRHVLTREERRKGQAKGAETKRQRREQAADEASARLADAVDAAVAKLIVLLDSEDETDQLRAAAQILDRVLGRPRQTLEHRVETAPIVVTEPVDTRPILNELAKIGLLDRAAHAAGPDSGTNGQP
jgi:adenylosuccinate synthase